jgi:hypothetical protein
MPLYLINVLRGGDHVGNFIIDAPHSHEFALLDRLSDNDKGQICYRFDLTDRPMPRSPQEVSFHLHREAPLLADQPATFESSNGDKIWIIRAVS